MTRDQLEHAIRIEKMIDEKILMERINLLNVEEQLRERLLQWVRISAEELEVPE